MKDSTSPLSRRHFLSASAASAPLVLASAGTAVAQGAAPSSSTDTLVKPPEGKRLLLSCKLSMIADKAGDKKLSLADRLSMAGEAGFDGVDLDEAGSTTPELARAAVRQSGVFVHNAINHAHWSQRLTSAKESERNTSRANIEHCIRVSHAAGGSGVLIVVGGGGDG